MSKNLTVGYWNIDGIVSRVGASRLWKSEDDSFLKLVQSFDIVGLVETHCAPEDVITIPGYSVFQVSRAKTAGAPVHSGGVAIGIRSDLVQHITVLPCDSSEYVWVKVDKAKFGLVEDLYIFFCYIPPSNSAFLKTSDDVMALIERDVARYSTLGACFGAGDFNAKTGTESDFVALDKHLPFPTESTGATLQSRNNADDHLVDNRGKDFLEFCKVTGLRILNGRTFGDFDGRLTCFAHPGKNDRLSKPSTLDYLLCSKPELVIMMRVHDLIPDLSIHCMVSAVFRARYVLDSGVGKTGEVPRPFCKFKWSKGDEIKFSRVVNSQEIQARIADLVSSSDLDSDELAVRVTAIITDSASLAEVKRSGRPRRSSRRKGPPRRKWFDSECLELRRRLRCCAKGLSLNPFNVFLQRQVIFLRRNYRKLLKKKEVKFRENVVNKMSDLHSSNPAEYWKLYRRLESEDCARRGGNEISGATWLNHFKAALNEGFPDKDEQFLKMAGDLVEREGDSIFNELCYNISDHEIRLMLARLKKQKAPSEDLIVNEMLLAGGDNFVPMLNKLFNQVLLSTSFPTIWTSSIIAPVHKKGDTGDPNNYRAVVVGSCLGKLFCSVLNNRLTNFCKVNSIIPEVQIGYQAKSRTADHIHTLRSLIDKYLKKGRHKQLFCCFVDFKSAFPSINRNLLFYKLYKVGVGGIFLRLLQSMYSSVDFCVRVEGGLSDTFTSCEGIKQGCTLSPLLFNIFTSDMPRSLQDRDSAQLDDRSISCLMYADDTVICSETKEGLQRSLNSLRDYCLKWNLTVNDKKTKVMVFHKGRQPRGDFWYGGTKLEIVQEYVYLGIVFTCSGSFKSALTRLAVQARKASFKIIKVMRKMSVKLALDLFDHLVVPILLYGAEVWAPLEFRNLNASNFGKICDRFVGEKVALKFYKAILGVNRYASTASVRGELGRMPILIRGIGAAFSYLKRSMYLPASSLLMASFRQSKMNEAGWSTCMDVILNRLKWNGKLCRTPFMESLCNLFLVDWRECLDSEVGVSGVGGNKLRTYSQFKAECKFETYLSIGTFYQRKVFCKIRISNHRLAIEAGRHRRPRLPVDDRVCKCCNGGVVEDERHFIIECGCGSLSAIREKFYSNIVRVLPDFRAWGQNEKFKFIMNGGTNAMETRKILSFVVELYEARSDLVM